MGPEPRGNRRFARRASVLVFILALLAPSCGWVSGEPKDDAPVFSADGRPLRPIPKVNPAGFADPPPGNGLARYENQQVRWAPCRNGLVGLQCGTVLAPLDYSQPDGTAITLSIAKKRASGARRLGTLFINPGGPGGSGAGYVGFFKSDGLEDYDIVGWDPRGVGESTPVQCGEGSDLEHYTTMDNSPDNGRETNALIEANRELGLACLKGSGALLEHISTVETVRDLELLRVLVHDRVLNYFGSSYGTSIGATYAQIFGKRVGRMVLDGAVNITRDKSVTQPEGFDRALNTFASWCVANSRGLGSTRTEVLGSIVAFWDRLDGAPIRVGSRALTQSLAVAAVVGVLYENQDIFPFLAQALRSAMVNNDGNDLLRFADQFNRRIAKGQFGQINYAFPAIRCLDTTDKGIQGELNEAVRTNAKAPTIGRFLGPDLVCPLWPVAADPWKATITAPDAPPIVVVGTTHDPVTPYEHAVGMANQLKSGVLVTFEGEGHLAYGQSPCIRRMVVKYLVDNVVPAAGARC